MKFHFFTQMFLKCFSIFLCFPLIQFESFKYINKFSNKYSKFSLKKKLRIFGRFLNILPKFYDFMTIILYICRKRIEVIQFGACTSYQSHPRNLSMCIAMLKIRLVVSSNPPVDRGRIDPPLVHRKKFLFYFYFRV